MNEERGQSRRVLLLGRSGYRGVDCVDWFSRDKPPNAADYHVVVVDAARLSEIIRQERGDKETPFPQIKRWQGWLGQLRERLLKLMKTDGMIVAIMDQPATAVGFKPEEPAKGWPVLVSSADWMPLPISFRSEEGKTLDVKEEAFRRYMNGVKKWFFLLEVDPTASLQDIRGEHGNDHIEVGLKPIAVNLQRLPIAGTVTYTVHKKHGGDWDTLPYVESGTLQLLPPPTAVPVEEGLRILLEDFCGLEVRTPEPEFAQRIGVPGEEELDAKIATKSQELAGLQQEIDAISTEKARKRRFRAVIYEKGIQGLQQVAREAFEEMGLTTRDADSDVSDEFMVSDGVSEVLVEVKGHRKSAQKEDIRQLDESLDEYEKKFGKSVKGILIVNAWCETPVEERDKGGTRSFPDNVVKRAEAIDAALVSGFELYNALCAVWEGKSTGQEIFARLIAGNGVIKLT